MAGDPNVVESWQEYRRLVLAELERLDVAIKNLDEKLDKRDKEQDAKVSAINLELLTLKIKASVYGALAGAIFSALVAIGSALLYRIHCWERRMAWHPDELPSTPLQPHERVQARRVLKWYEQKEFLQKTLKLWGTYLLGLPALAVSIWGVIQIFLTHGK